VKTGGRLRRAAPLVALVLLPLGALSGLAAWLVQDQAELVRQQAQALQQAHLASLGARVTRRLDERAAELAARLRVAPTSTEKLRALRRELPAVTGLLVLDQRGRVLHPPQDEPTSTQEQELLRRTRALWEQGGLPARAQALAGEGGPVGQGWLPFFHAGGLHLLLFVHAEGRWIAVELGRVSLLAEAVAALPADGAPTNGARGAAAPTASPPQGGVWALRDAHGAAVYGWGGPSLVSTEGAEALRVALPAPLGAWSFSAAPAAAAAETAATRGLTLGLGAGLLGLAVALSGLALWLYRERSRERRLAARRVGFVGQVSHELKTPLTNIRLYAELLQEEAEFDAEDDPEADARASQLRIIVGETRRLGRLIANLLSFARGEANRLKLRVGPGNVDETIAKALRSFDAALQAAGVQAEVVNAAGRPVLLDADALEQILANLLSNVLKYAAEGGLVQIRSEQRGERTTVSVRDRGPGVPAAQRERIFEPFARLSDRLDEGASGTGIGLDIARRLARLHGGDLGLRDCPAGACFVCTLHTPPAPERS